LARAPGAVPWGHGDGDRLRVPAGRDAQCRGAAARDRVAAGDRHGVTPAVDEPGGRDLADRPAAESRATAGALRREPQLERSRGTGEAPRGRGAADEERVRLDERAQRWQLEV